MGKLGWCAKVDSRSALSSCFQPSNLIEIHIKMDGLADSNQGMQNTDLPKWERPIFVKGNKPK